MATRFFPNYNANKVTSPFGMRTLNGEKRMHSGIDLVAKTASGGSATDYITAQKLEFRFRGLVIDLSSGSIGRSVDGTSWSSLKAMIPPAIDEHGDCMVTISSFNPASYPYLLFPFRNDTAAVTMDNFAGAILTINEPIGNGGYVG